MVDFKSEAALSARDGLFRTSMRKHNKMNIRKYRFMYHTMKERHTLIPLLSFLGGAWVVFMPLKLLAVTLIE